MLPPTTLPMTTAQIVKETKKLLEIEEAHNLQSAGDGELPRESETGYTIDLSGKGVPKLPVEVIELIRDKVERLALAYNPRIVLPKELLQCNRLRYLNVRRNHFTQFPEVILQLSNLEILDISRNRLTSIPEGIRKMSSLKFFAFAQNKVERLPLALGDMNSLTRLKLEDNPLEYPAREIHTPSDTSVHDWEQDKEVCTKVKRYMKTALMRERLMAPSKEDPGESNVETPRPPKRSVTGGRFPIRTSNSNLEVNSDAKSDSPSEYAPLVPQRSHARVDSTHAPSVKRPTIAPLVTGASESNRSRSSTASSSASLRQRRQGFVPIRKPTGDTPPLGEPFGQPSLTPTLRSSHSRNPSSSSARSGNFSMIKSPSYFRPHAPVVGRLDSVRRLSSLPENRNSNVQSSSAVKVAKRILFSLYQLERPIRDAASAVNSGSVHKSGIERYLDAACYRVQELDGLVKAVESGDQHRSRNEEDTTKRLLKTCVYALKSYKIIAAELKRAATKILGTADGIYSRCLMFQLCATIVESRNACTMLGAKVRDRSASQETPRLASKAWNSRTVTPTPPKPSLNRRMRGATILRNMPSTSTLRVVPPPPIPLNGADGRSGTMTSLSAATPRSSETFAGGEPTFPSRSRTNTMRSIVDEPEGGEPFDSIFLKLHEACTLAAETLPQCRGEFHARMEASRGSGQRGLVHQWSMAITKCEAVITHNANLKKRLEVVRVNDPALKYQRDFWQLCDAFVKSWTDLATGIKDIGAQQIDIQTIKQVMRIVQRKVKDVSKTISHSPLYHHALGTRSADTTIPRSSPEASFSSAFTSSFPTSMPGSGTNSGYVTPLPATPLSAALGPAAQATVANTLSGHTHIAARDYFPESAMPRAPRDRNDTPLPPAPHAKR